MMFCKNGLVHPNNKLKKNIQKISTLQGKKTIMVSQADVPIELSDHSSCSSNLLCFMGQQKIIEIFRIIRVL